MKDSRILSRLKCSNLYFTYKTEAYYKTWLSSVQVYEHVYLNLTVSKPVYEMYFIYTEEKNTIPGQSSWLNLEQCKNRLLRRTALRKQSADCEMSRWTILSLTNPEV